VVGWDADWVAALVALVADFHLKVLFALGRTPAWCHFAFSARKMQCFAPRLLRTVSPSRRRFNLGSNPEKQGQAGPLTFGQ